MKITSNTVGTWFPTGFYGHHRNKTRADFLVEYRQLAKPQPPERFIHRSAQPISSHAFSNHDNRDLFTFDVNYFSQGHGKKKYPRYSGSQRSTVTLPSCKVGQEPDHPLTSTYRRDFKMEEPNIQMLVNRPSTSLDGPPTTIYRTVYGSDPPNYHFINAMSNEALMLSVHSRQNQAKMKKMKGEESVASCLSWVRPHALPASINPDFDHISIRHVEESGITSSSCHRASDMEGMPEIQQ